MNKNCRIMYLRDENGRPVGCIAMVLGRNRKTLHYQLSVLNPVDKFDRTLGRLLSLGRMVEQPIKLKGFNGTETQFDISCYIMEDIVADGSFPKRARRAAQQWLNHNDVFPIENSPVTRTR